MASSTKNTAYGIANRVSNKAKNIKSAVGETKQTATQATNQATNKTANQATAQTASQTQATDQTANQTANQTQQEAMQAYLQQYAPSVDYTSVYNDYASKLNKILQQQKEALNQSTTSQARAAYVENQQDSVEIPRTLSNAGVSGGLAEKIRTNRNTSYQKNLANIFSQKAAQDAEYEKNNANLINEAYKEAMTNQQTADNERALAAQQYANQVALQQQQQAYEEQQAKTQAANDGLNAALLGDFKDVYDTKTGKFKVSVANQMSNYYNDAKANGASQATLDNFETAMILAAQERYHNNPDNRKTKMTWQEYKQKYVGDRIGKTY